MVLAKYKGSLSFRVTDGFDMRIAYNIKRREYKIQEM
jgi:hypothetical protein